MKTLGFHSYFIDERYYQFLLHHFVGVKGLMNIKMSNLELFCAVIEAVTVDRKTYFRGVRTDASENCNLCCIFAIQ